MKTISHMRRHVLHLALVCSAVLPATAQITVTDMDESPGLTAQNLANTLAGSGVSIVANSAGLIQQTDVNASTPDTPLDPLAAAGTFTIANSALGPGFTGGVILSSGRADSIQGTANAGSITGNYNVSPSTSGQASLLGDAQLETLYGDALVHPFRDATALEFDFIPDASQVSIQFVFASEEYDEYVDAGYNDIFAIFVNGQTVNLATVEPNDEPVSIDTVNLDQNRLLYRNNDIHNSPVPVTSHIATEADGLTTLVTCTFTVNAGVANTLKLVIADRSDFIYDSWALVKGASLTTVKPLIVTTEVEQPAIGLGAGEPVSGYNRYTINLTNTGSSAATVYEIQDLLPRGFQYEGSGIIGDFTTDEPASTSYEYLVWTGPYTVPANTTVSMHFWVHPASEYGIFYNNATAIANVPVIPSGESAPLDVRHAFKFAVISPEAIEIPQGGTYNHEKVLFSSDPPPRTFTIKNVGGLALSNITVTAVYPTSAQSFAMDTTGTATYLAPDETTTFTAQYEPMYHDEPTHFIISSDEFQIYPNTSTTPFEFTLQGDSSFTLDTAQAAYVKASNTSGGHLFGAATSVSGDTMVVGSPFENGISTGVNGSQAGSGSSPGAVYVYRRNPVTGAWAQEAYIKASNHGGSQDAFGGSVAISGDTLVVGAPTEDSNATGINGDQSDNSASDSGAVYVFTRSGTTWTQQAYLKASNTEANDYFGSSLAIDGNTIIVGAPEEDSIASGVNGNQADNSGFYRGAAYVFVRSGTTWTQQAYLKASAPADGDLFGASVAVEGNTIAVGAPQYDTGAGFVGLFSRSGTTWSHRQNITAFNAEAGDWFGISVALSNGGNSIIVGAPGESSSGTGVNSPGNNNSNPGSGAAYIFRLLGSTWSHWAFLKGSSTTVSSNFFGGDVALDQEIAAVGAQSEDSSSTGINGDDDNLGASNSGAVFLFAISPSGWAQRDYVKASDTNPSDAFGSSVGISGDILVVGAPYENSNATGINGNQTNSSAMYSGAAYIFDLLD